MGVCSDREGVLFPVCMSPFEERGAGVRDAMRSSGICILCRTHRSQAVQHSAPPLCRESQSFAAVPCMSEAPKGIRPSTWWRSRHFFPVLSPHEPTSLLRKPTLFSTPPPSQPPPVPTPPFPGSPQSTAFLFPPAAIYLVEAVASPRCASSRTAGWAPSQPRWQP